MTVWAWVLLVGVILIVTYEVVAAVRNTDPDPLTISQIIWDVSTRTPAVPFFFGLLMGHLFLR